MFIQRRPLSCFLEKRCFRPWSCCGCCGNRFLLRYYTAVPPPVCLVDEASREANLVCLIRNRKTASTMASLPRQTAVHSALVVIVIVESRSLLNYT